MDHLLSAVLHELSAAVLVIAAAPPHSLVFCNEAARGVLGVEDDWELTPERWDHLSYFDAAGRPIPFEELPLPRAVSSGDAVRRDLLEIRFEDGTRRFHASTAKPLRNDEGTIEVYLLIVEDRTKEEERRRRIAHGERLFRSVFEHSPIGILLADPRGQVIALNEAYLRTIGVPRSMRHRASDYNIGDLVPYKEAGIHPAFRALLDGRPFRRETRVTSVAGKEVWAVYTGVPIRSESGEVEQVLVLLEDVAEQRETELQLRQMEAMEATARLAGGMAHDINNTMTAVAGYTELLLAGETDPRKRRYLEQITDAAEQVTELVATLSRLDVHSGRPDEAVDVADVTWRAAQHLAHHAPPGVDVDIEVQSGPLEAHADRLQLRDSLEEVFRNAVDAMPEGGRIRVEVGTTRPPARLRKCFPALPDAECIRVAVTDTGIGIPAEVAHRIFEPYATSKLRGADKGTGLGLSLVYAFISEMGGAVVAHSQVGEGTRVELVLPMANGSG